MTLPIVEEWCEFCQKVKSSEGGFYFFRGLVPFMCRECHEARKAAAAARRADAGGDDDVA